ncbi:ABC transporter substrate-binding protein [Geomesophilobacter sediminis]|uniref:ABC transporter substrate-binding protein n=1 Tax=Geomesophilobacter sediminis TaxID=2798584 RepID=A0A8J7SBB7_9BACT|nr:ABC transporter substrate-binding protein [Geomesophilobacter sediminis]MBJ6727990.1 ABC transporter substrate-binding protein [Geomesophilobacter sediminis]
MKRKIVAILGAVAALSVAVAVHAAAPAKKIRVGFFGTICEAPLFAAYEQGFFKEEGLDVEMIRGDANTLREGLALNKVDVTDGVLMQWIKPIEQGLKVKFTAGIHTGCIQILAGNKTKIRSLKDLAGKRVGVPAIGGGPHNLASRALFTAGIDPKNGVTWKAFPMSELELALEKGEIDAIASADPIAQIIVDKGKARSILNSAKTTPYNQEYCCLVVVNGKFIKEHPDTAAAATRAILKAARWVSKNPQAAAKLSVDKKYVPGNPEVNAKILSGYHYVPSVKGGENAILIAAREMKETGVLNKSTDVNQLAKFSFQKLKGVE